MIKLKNITISMLVCISFIFASCSENNEMTSKDQEEVKTVISKYFQAVIQKDFETVHNLTESNQKKYYSLEELKEKELGIRTLRINNFKPFSGIDKLKGTPTRLFKVDLDITPNGYGSWNDGINPRFIWGVMEGNEWKVSGFAESPSGKVEEYFRK